MTLSERFFPKKIRIDKKMDVFFDTSQDIEHERMFEAGQTRVDGRPLYVGFGFTGKRFFGAGICMGLLFVGLITRAVWMQGIQGMRYHAMAEENRLREVPLWPRRGVVRDRNGVVLAENAPRFQVTVTPRDVETDPDARTAELSQVARTLGMSITDLTPLVNVTGLKVDEPALVADAITYDQAIAFAVKLPNLPGFRLDARPKRSYPQSADTQSLSHLLGYVGKISEDELLTRADQGYQHVDELGKTGIERTYESTLRGTVGARTYEADARGHLKGAVQETAPTDGKDVSLTIDLRLQKIAEQTLRDELTKINLSRGAVIAMDPRNGDILAMVSLPAFNNNDFSGGVSSTVYHALALDEHQPLFNRAISGIYPSGSTVKLVVSTAALMEKVVTDKTTILSTGGIRLGQWFFPDWKAGGHGVTDVRKAIAWSINTFFYLVGGGGQQGIVGMGPEALSGWMKKFGLGAKTGIDLPSESSGFVPTPQWKQDVRKEPWYIGDTYNLSIGQGDLLVTPIQVARYTAAIANGGKLVTPRLVDAGPPIMSDQLADPANIKTVQLGMRDAVTYGSARSLSTLPFNAAAKTGTAQWSKTANTHAWFTSFAPFEDPQIVVTVLIDEGGEGSSVSAPVAKKILEAWNNLDRGTATTTVTSTAP